MSEQQQSDAANAQATQQTTMADIAAGIPDQQADQGEKPVADQSKARESGLPKDMQEMQDFFTQNKSAIDQMREQVEEATGILTASAQREAQRELDAAVDNAVKAINEGVDGNADLAETFLNYTYQKNPDVKKIFDNRDRNPEALKRALGLLHEEWKAMNQKQIDPQVAENQRALQESQRSGQPASDSGDEDARLEKMSDGEFLHHMRSLAASL